MKLTLSRHQFVLVDNKECQSWVDDFGWHIIIGFGKHVIMIMTQLCCPPLIIECHSILSQRKLLHKTQNTVHDNHFSHHRCNKYVTYHPSWSIPSAWDYATCHSYIGWDHLHPIWNPIFLALLKCERAPSTLRYTIEGLRWSYSKTHVNNVLSFGRFQKRLLGVVFGFGTREIQWKREREREILPFRVHFSEICWRLHHEGLTLRHLECSCLC